MSFLECKGTHFYSKCRIFARNMSNNYFKFQKFTIFQDQCAMKVGTDGPLLGAWAEGGSRILDVGTGTGLIALMMAQRFADADVTAIDVDEAACRQAGQNVEASPFAKRVHVECCPLQQFVAKRFDTIVSNPPYFSDSLKAPDQQRSTARHNDSLTYQELCFHAYRLMTDEGVFSVVVPFDYLERFLTVAQENKLFLSRKCSIKTTPRKTARRYLLAFRKQPVPNTATEEGVIEVEPNVRSEWYKNLTKEFYL